MVEKLKMSAGEVVDVSAMVGSLSTDLICLMVFGRKYGDHEDFDQRGLKAAIHELVHVSSDFNLADFAPFLGVLDLQGHGKKMKSLVEVFDQFFDNIIDEHIKTKGSKDKDESGTFVGLLMSNIAEFNQDEDVEVKVEMTKANVKALLLVNTLAHINHTLARAHTYIYIKRTSWRPHRRRRSLTLDVHQGLGLRQSPLGVSKRFS